MPRIQTAKPNLPATETKIRTLVDQSTRTLYREMELRLTDLGLPASADALLALVSRAFQTTLDASLETSRGEAMAGQAVPRMPRRTTFLKGLRQSFDTQLLDLVETAQRGRLESFLENPQDGARTTWSLPIPRGAAVKVAKGLIERVGTLENPRTRTAILSLLTCGHDPDEIEALVGAGRGSTGTAGSSLDHPLMQGLLQLTESVAIRPVPGCEGWIATLKTSPLSPSPKILDGASRGTQHPPFRDALVLALRYLGDLDTDVIARSLDLTSAEVETITAAQGALPTWSQTGPFAVDQSAWSRAVALTDLHNFLEVLTDSNTDENAPDSETGPFTSRWNLCDLPLKLTALWVVGLFKALSPSSSRESAALPSRETLSELCDRQVRSWLESSPAS